MTGCQPKQLLLLSFRAERGTSTAVVETLRCAHAVSQLKAGQRAKRGDNAEFVLGQFLTASLTDQLLSQPRSLTNLIGRA